MLDHTLLMLMVVVGKLRLADLARLRRVSRASKREVDDASTCSSPSRHRRDGRRSRAAADDPVPRRAREFVARTRCRECGVRTACTSFSRTTRTYRICTECQGTGYLAMVGRAQIRRLAREAGRLAPRLRDPRCAAASRRAVPLPSSSALARIAELRRTPRNAGGSATPPRMSTEAAAPRGRRRAAEREGERDGREDERLLARGGDGGRDSRRGATGFPARGPQNP